MIANDAKIDSATEQGRERKFGEATSAAPRVRRRSVGSDADFSLRAAPRGDGASASDVLGALSAAGR
jgi:hypothetical protein